MEELDLFGNVINQPQEQPKIKTDWVGTKHSTFVTLGASNHTDHERAIADYYATDPIAAQWLLEIEPSIHNIWECACGECHLAQVFEKAGKLNKATDIINRQHPLQTETLDFLKCGITNYKGSIVTNPPYTKGLEFVQHCLYCVAEGELVCMFLKLTFCEGKERRKFFDENPPIRIWVSSSRISCANNGDFKKYQSSAACYAWFIWQKGYNGQTTLKWFN